MLANTFTFATTPTNKLYEVAHVNSLSYNLNEISYLEKLYIGSPLLISLDIFCRCPNAEDCALRALAELKLRADAMLCCPAGQRRGTLAPAIGLRSLCALALPRLSLSALCALALSDLSAVCCILVLYCVSHGRALALQCFAQASCPVYVLFPLQLLTPISKSTRYSPHAFGNPASQAVLRTEGNLGFPSDLPSLAEAGRLRGQGYF